MASGKYARIVSDGLDDAARRIDSWSARGMSDAVKQGMDEFGFRLAVAAYDNMKLPSVGKRDPLHVGLRWRRTKQFHKPPEPTGRPAEWLIRTQPQYLAMWQEAGTRPHVVFDPDKQRSKAFMRTVRRQRRAEDRLTKLTNIQNRDTNEERRKQYAEKSIKKREAELQVLKAATGTNAVMGYSEPGRIPKKNQQSDWFKGNTPTAEAGRRRGQPRPVQVRAGSKVQTNKGTAATRPIWFGAVRIRDAHRDRMAALMTQAYERRGR